MHASKKPEGRYLTASNRIALFGTLCISVGFLLVIWMQSRDARATLYEAILHRNVHATELIASQLYGAARWRKPKVIQQIYNTIVSHDHLGVTAVMTLDRDGELLTAYQKDASQPVNFGQALPPDVSSLAYSETHTARLDSQFIVTTPIISGNGMRRAGTVAIAWDLSRLDGRADSMMLRAAMITLVLLAAFITISLIIFHKYLSRPLSQITEATHRVANGDKTFEIPWTHRNDEIGDMARSLVTFRENVALIDRLTAEQQQQTQRLSNALEKEREYNALHREFVTMVSHEFRTPVAIIDGAAQRIDRRIGKDTPEQLQERTGKIRGAVSRMIELIDSTLSVSRIEAGTIELQLNDCDFATLLRDVCQRQQDISKKHKISVTIADMPASVWIDSQRMDQVFTNLLSNAVKYAPESPNIDVKAGMIGKNVVVSVRDSGVGIPKDEMSKLFEKFFRASTSTGIPGTGIGLHLVKHLVELHDGTITVDSTEGQGTTFSVTFPIKTHAGSTGAPSSAGKPEALTA